MENNCGIIGLREDEVALDLGLSIGGSFGKAEKRKPIKHEPKPNKNSVADLGETVVFDPRTKREVQALRRQEARKQRKGGIYCHRNGEFRSKDKGAVAMEEREYKKTRVEEFSCNVNPNLIGELNNPLVCPALPVRIPGPYPQLQFVPLANGFAYSCVNAVQPVAVEMNGGFPSFQTALDSGVNGGNGKYSEQNSSRDERKKKTGSNGSTIYSSSTGSDLQSSSNQGGCSSETGTHTPRINISMASNLKGQSQQSATSHQTDSAQSKPQAESDDNSKPVSTNETATTAAAAFSKDTKGKPPKPRTPTNDDVLSVRNMPCVSTTGNGPDGRTINGFLHRYTNSEVSIICVCHGSSFTPAEFVHHAGGIDISHPLRHITMVPNAF